MAETDQLFSAFGPEDIESLNRAFAEVCNRLHVFAGDRRGREAVATRIIDLAKTGVRDAAALRDRVLMEAMIAA